MFVASVKAKRKNVLLVIFLILVLILVTTTTVAAHDFDSEVMMGGQKYNLRAESNENRIASLIQFGWEATGEPAETHRVTTPATFSEVYERYNALQKGQELDLTCCADEVYRQWVYQINNATDQGSFVRATILAYSDKVTGGDIGSTPLDGLMYGLAGSDRTTPGNTARQLISSAEPAKETNASEVPTNAWPTD